MLFAADSVDSVEIVDLATGETLDALPDPEPPHVRLRRLQRRPRWRPVPPTRSR